MNRLLKDLWIFGIILISSASSALALDLSAITVYGCDEQGAVDVRFRCNTGPIDPAWDVFVYNGDVGKKENSEKIEWLNKKSDNTIRVPLTPGTHTFTFHIDYLAEYPRANASKSLALLACIFRPNLLCVVLL
jgi:hypothetical protein